MELETYIDELGYRHSFLQRVCEDNLFLEKVVDYWFWGIAPARAMEYGTSCWEDLGEMGVIAQVLNCYCRWRHMMQDPVDLDLAPKIKDAMVDAFGYSMIMSVLVKRDMNEVPWNRIWTPGPSGPFRTELQEMFKGRRAIEIPDFYSLAMSYAMWREVQEDPR
jgi:hypothetical protein